MRWCSSLPLYPVELPTRHLRIVSGQSETGLKVCEIGDRERVTRYIVSTIFLVRCLPPPPIAVRRPGPHPLGPGPGRGAVGIGGGLVGAAYVAALHLLQRVLGPGRAPRARAARHPGGRRRGRRPDHPPGRGDRRRRAAGRQHPRAGRCGGRPAPPVADPGVAAVRGRRAAPWDPRRRWCRAPAASAPGSAPGPAASRADVRILTITGMAAGFTVLFGAPLGSALFALEILHRRGLQYYEALLPAVVGSLCGYGVYVGPQRGGHRAGVVLPPGRHAPRRRPRPGRRGGTGRRGRRGRVRRTRRDRGSTVLPAVPRLGPLRARRAGARPARPLVALRADLRRGPARRLLDGGPTSAAGALAVALVAKLLGTTVTLASGWKGGFIIPLFFMGATLGQLAAPAVPGRTRRC